VAVAVLVQLEAMEQVIAEEMAVLVVKALSQVLLFIMQAVEEAGEPAQVEQVAQVEAVTDEMLQELAIQQALLTPEAVEAVAITLWDLMVAQA
jgi:hypothetical protein